MSAVSATDQHRSDRPVSLEGDTFLASSWCATGCSRSPSDILLRRASLGRRKLETLEHPFDSSPLVIDRLTSFTLAGDWAPPCTIAAARMRPSSPESCRRSSSLRRGSPPFSRGGAARG